MLAYCPRMEDKSARSSERRSWIPWQRRGAEIAYVRTASGFEVDFLARYPDGKAELIQVCANLDNNRLLWVCRGAFQSIRRCIGSFHELAGFLFRSDAPRYSAAS